MTLHEQYVNYYNQLGELLITQERERRFLHQTNGLIEQRIEAKLLKFLNVVDEHYTLEFSIGGVSIETPDYFKFVTWGTVNGLP